MIRGVIFDLDGTLADTLADISAALNFASSKFGLAAQPAAVVREWIGDGLATLCQRALGPDQDVSIEDLMAAFAEHYEAHRFDHVLLFDGVPALLDDLTERGIAMAVLSNKPHRHTVPMVETLFGRWQFTAVQGHTEDERRKPDPRTTLEIIGRMGLSAGDVMFIGDSHVDMHTARRAGAVPVGVSWGYANREELIEAGAARVVDQAGDIVGLLRD